MSAGPSAQAVDTPVADAAGLVMRAVCLQHGDGAETVHALDNVDLVVRRGELAAVVGPSSAGKSSLLAVAGGLARPDSGTELVDGADMTVAGQRERARLRREKVGFVFQTGNLLPALTAADQLRFPLRFGKRSGAERDPLELLGGVGLREKADRRPHQLSGGERQRAGMLARW